MPKETVLFNAADLNLDNLTAEQVQFVAQALREMMQSPGWGVLVRMMQKYRIDKMTAWLDSDDGDKVTMRTYRTIMDEVLGLPARFLSEAEAGSKASGSEEMERDLAEALGFGRSSSDAGLAIPD